MTRSQDLRLNLPPTSTIHPSFTQWQAVLEVLEVSWRLQGMTTSLPPLVVCVSLEVAGRLERQGSRQRILITR